MKFNFTPRLILLAMVTGMFVSCSVNDEETISTKKVEPQLTETMNKSGDSTFMEGEPLIPKPRG